MPESDARSVLAPDSPPDWGLHQIAFHGASACTGQSTGLGSASDRFSRGVTELDVRCVCLTGVGVSALDTGSDHEYRLVRDLMARYNRQVRPSLNSSEPLNVTFGAALAQIIDVVSRLQATQITLTS